MPWDHPGTSLLLVAEGAEKRPLEVVEVGGEVPLSDEFVGVLAVLGSSCLFFLFLGGFPNPLDLDFGVTGAGPAERRERTVAGMLRAEKKKVELPLGLSRRACCAGRSCA